MPIPSSSEPTPGIHCSGDLAFSTGFTRFAATVGGDAIDLWTRETLCYRKYEGNWRIFHDHVSVPVDLGSGPIKLLA
jgi:ketosteroid isomerase-like protein